MVLYLNLIHRPDPKPVPFPPISISHWLDPLAYLTVLVGQLATDHHLIHSCPSKLCQLSAQPSLLGIGLP